MARKSGKKRKLAQYAEDDDQNGNNVGIGATLSHLRAQDEATPERQSMENSPASEGWTKVGRGGKKAKMTNYPSLGYSDLHKLQSMVNINHLQGLVLYCLADGNMAPSWVSVRHHGMVKKAVVLFVPGLEKGMFNGDIDLESLEADLIDFSEPADTADTSPPVEEDSISSSNHANIPNPFTEPGKSVMSSLVSVSAAADKRKESSHRQGQLEPGVSTNIQNQSNANKNAVHMPTQSPDDYLPMQLTAEKLSLPLKPLAGIFTHLWPIKTPGDERYGKVHSPLHAILNSPITKTQEEKQEDRQIKGPKPAREARNWKNTRTQITEFIASKEELQENEFTLHDVWFTDPEERDVHTARRLLDKQTKGESWVDTYVKNLEEGTVPDDQIQKGSVTAGRIIVAVDCEMCKVEGGDMALTRISLVKWDGTVLMDELVKPDKPIIDYLTPYSGITPAKLEKVTTSLTEIQTRLLQEITPQHILIGHSLNADLHAIQITHPFIIDTSILYPHPRGPPMKSSLKWLAQKYLNREIQKGHGTRGHDSIEDARACLDLVKMKCERGPQWGTSEATTEPIFKRLKRAPKPGFSKNNQDGKIGAIVDHGAPEKNFGTMASYCIGCRTDAEVVDGIKRAVLGDQDGSYIPGGGVDFTWARFQELASVRGWLLDYRHTTNPDAEHEPTASDLAAAVSQTVQHIKSVRDCLPPCTLFIVCSGTGDPREMARLQDVQRTFKREFQTRKWDELSVKWTDVEEQALKAAVRRTREGVGFLTIT